MIEGRREGGGADRRGLGPASADPLGKHRSRRTVAEAGYDAVARICGLLVAGRVRACLVVRNAVQHAPTPARPAWPPTGPAARPHPHTRAAVYRPGRARRLRPSRPAAPRARVPHGPATASRRTA